MVAMKMRSSQLAVAAISLVALIFVAMPLLAYFNSASYRWEMSSADFVQGGIEALCLFAWFVLAASLPVARGWRIALTLIAALVYLRVHAADLPLVFMVVWLEGMLATGAFLLPLSRVSAGALFSMRFALGICIWILGLLLLSILHLALPEYLLIYSTLLFAAALLKLRKKPFALKALEYVVHRDRQVSAPAAFALLCVLILSARIPSVVDFDSIWYGLRGNWVLAPHGSIFDHLNLLGQVFYYPKLYESLLLPANWFPDFSFSCAISIAAYLACGICGLATARALGLRQRHAMLALALVLSMPAMTTMAMTAKPDLLASFFLLLGSLSFITAITRCSPIWVLGVFGAVLLGLATKLSAVPYGGLLSLSALVMLGCQLYTQKARNPPGDPAERRLMWLFLGLSLVIFTAFCLRTYLLTGYPAVGDQSIARIFNLFGFRPRYPVHIRLDTQGFASSYASVFYDYLFSPVTLLSVSYDWPGSGGALLFVLGCACALVAKSRSPLIRITLGLSPILAAGCFLAVSYGASAGGAGYYYIFPVTLAGLLGLGLAWGAMPAIRALICSLVAVVVAANAFIGFLSSPGASHAGTAPFSLDLSRPALSAARAREADIREEGLQLIDQFMRQQLGAGCRAIAAGDWQTLYELPCITENLGLNSEQLFPSDKAFIEYLNYAKVNLLVVPKFAADTPLYRTAAYLRAQGLPVIDTPAYYAVDLRSIIGAIPVPAVSRSTAAAEVDLLDKLSLAIATDLHDAANPRRDLYGIAPNDYVYFTEDPATLLIQPDVALSYPIAALDLPAKWTFSATLGMKPEDSVRDAAPVAFSVRLIGVDGAVLEEKSWRVTAGDYPSVSLDSPHGPAVRLAYIELSCNGTAGAMGIPPPMLIGQPVIHFK